MKQAIQLFEERKVRTVWDDEQEKWYFLRNDDDLNNLFRKYNS